MALNDSGAAVNRVDAAVRSWTRVAGAFPRGFPTCAATCVMLLALAVPTWAQRPAAEWNLQALMATMHAVRSSSARFIETKYLRLLNQAQRSSGQLHYVAPGYLQRVTVEPASARLTINGDLLTVEQKGEPTRAISLRDHSEIGGLTESIRATLAGDLPALTRHFSASLEGGVNRWTLTLVPKEPKLREMVATIRIQGERDAIREVVTHQADGDRTEMAVLPDPK